MSRINDVGGMQGFAPIPTGEEEPPFHADWEARVFALFAALNGRGVITSHDLRDAIERLPPERYLNASYYERWFTAICTLLVEKDVVEAADLEVPHG